LLADVKADVQRAGDVVHGIRRMIKKGKTVRRPINMNELVRQVMRILNPEALLNSCELKTALEPNLPTVEGDPVEIQQVLVNLVINSIEAMQYTPSEKRQVVVSSQRTSGNAIEVSVQDKGYGLTEEMRTRLFEQFFTTKSEGLGLGLAISRSIVEAHKGKIAAENVKGGGARFYFTLPITQEIARS
jgi:signal transduction histidine kinase